MPKEYYHDIDLNRNQLYNSRLQNVTTAARILLGNTLNIFHKGFQVYDTDILVPYYWDGTAWQTAVNGAIWGNITGLITNQTDLITYLSGNYVPLTRNLTINGVTYDLSADRIWTINSLPSQVGNAGYWLTTDGTNASWQALSGNISQFTNDVGYLTSFTETDPIFTAWLATPPNISAFVNDVGYITSWGPETDPLFTAWLAGPPNLSEFTNDTNYITLLSLSGGTGISYDNTTGVITNASPDQVVAISSGTGISVTGTYPNFTIDNTGTYTSPLTTKGDVFVRSTVDDRLPVGTNGQILAANSATATGLEWIPNAANSLINTIASGTDTYTATVPGIISYTDGETILVRFTNGNTTGCTLNINGLGAIPLYRNNDGPLIGGDIYSGSEMLCVYNAATPSFQCIGTSPNSLLAYVTNADSVPITKGMAVYAFSGVGDRMTVKRAYNTSDATSAQTVGLVLSTSIGVNQKGFIMMQGLLDGLSILPTATWTDGDPVYLGATAGTITNVKPSAPNHLVYLGVVTTASNGSAGRLYVRVQNGYELDELHNVALTSPPNNNDGLFYETATSLWKNKSIPTVLGYTPITAYYQDTAPGSPIANSFWMDSDTGMLYQYVDDGTSAQWVEQTLPIGPQGPQGVSGTNNIDLLTSTTLTGLLKGDGVSVSATTVVTELGYTPEDVANKSIDSTFAANSDTLYPSQKAVKTALDNFSDDVDYAIMINQKIQFNL